MVFGDAFLLCLHTAAVLLIVESPWVLWRVLCTGFMCKSSYPHFLTRGGPKSYASRSTGIVSKRFSRQARGGFPIPLHVRPVQICLASWWVLPVSLAQASCANVARKLGVGGEAGPRGGGQQEEAEDNKRYHTPADPKGSAP